MRAETDDLCLAVTKALHASDRSGSWDKCDGHTDNGRAEADSIDQIRQETLIDWPKLFPHMSLGRHRDPVDLARSIRRDVAKLRSVSDAGRKAIFADRCAERGISPDGVPTLYRDRTRLV